MHEIQGYLDLAALNSEIAQAYLKDAEDELRTVVEKLEACLESITQLRQYEPISHNRQHLDSREPHRIN